MPIMVSRIIRVKTISFEHRADAKLSERTAFDEFKATFPDSKEDINDFLDALVDGKVYEACVEGPCLGAQIEWFWKGHSNNRSR